MNFNTTNSAGSYSTRMHISAGGNVGINTTSPDSNHKLEVASGGTAEAGIRSGNSSEAILNFGRTSDRLRGRIAYNNSSEYMAFWTNQGEKMRLSGTNLSVGTTTTDVYDSTSETGSVISDGYLAVARASSVAYFNRLSSDGRIVDFRRSGSVIGSIGGFDSGQNLYIGSGDTGVTFNPTVDGILPHNQSTNAQRDNAIDLGYSTVRFKDGYFGGQVLAQFFTGVGDTDTYMDISSNPANTIKFYTGGAEKARISSNVTPKFFVGCTVNPSASVAGTAISTTDAGSFQSFAGATTTSTHAIFGNTNGAVGTIQTTNSTTAYNTSSDRRLKSNIEDAASASDKIDAIQVRQFDWNVDNSHQDYGLIAQELQPIEPLAVTGSADSDEMMGVDYSKLVPMLIKEIQELRGRVAALEAN